MTCCSGMRTLATATVPSSTATSVASVSSTKTLNVVPRTAMTAVGVVILCKFGQPVSFSIRTLIDPKNRRRNSRRSADRSLKISLESGRTCTRGPAAGPNSGVRVFPGDQFISWQDGVVQPKFSRRLAKALGGQRAGKLDDMSFARRLAEGRAARQKQSDAYARQECPAVSRMASPPKAQQSVGQTDLSSEM